MENGADIRFIQELLGHAELQATKLYTHVSIRKLKEVHQQTHPSAKLGRAQSPSPEGKSTEDDMKAKLLDALEVEAREEDGKP